MTILKGKVAIITGASQGIGRDTALALSQAGAKVAVAARNEEKLATLVSEIAAAGGEAIAIKMDVADADQVKSGFKAVVEKFGGPECQAIAANVEKSKAQLRPPRPGTAAVNLREQTSKPRTHSSSRRPPR